MIIVATLPFVGVEGYQQFLHGAAQRLATSPGVANNLDLGSTVLRLGGGPLVRHGRALSSAMPSASWRCSCQPALRPRGRLHGHARGDDAAGAAALGPLPRDRWCSRRPSWPSAAGPWGLALPLLAWLPQPLTPLIVLASTLLPFLAREPVAPPAGADTEHEPGAGCRDAARCRGAPRTLPGALEPSPPTRPERASVGGRRDFRERVLEAHRITDLHPGPLERPGRQLHDALGALARASRCPARAAGRGATATTRRVAVRLRGAHEQRVDRRSA